MDISQPQQELCDDRGQAMSHTRDSGGSPYHAERASLNTPLLSLPISLFASVARQKQQSTADDKRTHCVSKIHSAWPHRFTHSVSENNSVSLCFRFNNSNGRVIFFFSCLSAEHPLHTFHLHWRQLESALWVAVCPFDSEFTSYWVFFFKSSSQFEDMFSPTSHHLFESLNIHNSV